VGGTSDRVQLPQDCPRAVRCSPALTGGGLLHCRSELAGSDDRSRNSGEKARLDSAAVKRAGDEGTESGSEQEPTAETRVANGDPADIDEPGLERGDRLGRYTILGRLGRGGMGVVYAAYDPRLDRRVALKLLRADARSESDQELARTRLLREAQAMARLSHPNVAAVYDVGRFGDEIYVAIEYVPGRNLHRWLRDEKPGWEPIVEIFLRAGRGLAAAHASGLVHRDFKPGNVIVADDGRPRVLDFGLARPIEEGAGQSSSDGLDVEPRNVALDTPLTQQGMVVGTPYYMSPEHYRGATNAHSDQFSFCSALYEALYGQRPFSARDHRQLFTAVMEGDLREPPQGTRVPARLFDVIRRGMRVEPADRYPSMHALLAALARARRKPWHRAAAGLAVVGIASSLFLVYLAAGERAKLCEPPRDKIDAVWGIHSKEAIAQAFMATNVPYARAAWEGAEVTVDGYARDWLAMRREACLATHAHHEQSAQLFDLRMLCLDERLAELGALTSLFATADAQVVENAVAAAAELSPLAGCADVRALTDRVRPPDDRASRARVAQLRAGLATALALRRAGKYERGLEVARPIADEAARVGYRPIEAEALFLRGSLELKSGDPSAGAQSLAAAALAAIAVRDDTTAARACTQLVFALGYRLGKHAEADTWARTALALLERSQGGQALEADVRINIAVLRSVQGRYDEAREQAQQALALRRSVMGDEHPLTASAHHTLGVVHKKRGDYGLALREYERALAIHKASVGEDHPDVAMSLHNIGVVHKREKRPREAEKHLRQALAIWEATLAEDHPNIGMALLNLGVTLTELGQYDTAEESLQRAHNIKRARLGSKHPSVAKTSIALAHVAQSRGRLAEALALARSGVDSFVSAVGDEHPDLPAMRANLGELCFLLAGETWTSPGNRREALELATQARTAYEQAGQRYAAELARVEHWIDERR